MASKSDNWDNCPQGTLVNLGGRLRGHSRRRQLAQSAVSAAVMALLVVAGGILMMGPWGSGGGAGSPAVQLSCEQVQMHLAAYVGGQLDGEVHTQVAEHLDHCPFCRRRLEELEGSGRQESSADAPVTAAVIPWPR